MELASITALGAARADSRLLVCLEPRLDDDATHAGLVWLQRSCTPVDGLFLRFEFPQNESGVDRSGAEKLASAHEIPYSLTLSEAVAADEAHLEKALVGLRGFFVVASLGVEVSSSREHP